MKLNIRNWGNSAGVRLPVQMLRQIGAKIGDQLEVEIDSGTVLLRVAKPCYRLDELLSEMPEGLPKVEGWDEMPCVGKEL